MKENNEKQMPRLSEKEKEVLINEIKSRLIAFNPKAFKKCDLDMWPKHIAFKFGKDGEIQIRVPSVFTSDNEFMFCIALVRIIIPKKYQRKGIGSELIKILEDIAAANNKIDGVVLELVGTVEMKSLALKLGYKKDPRIDDIKDGLFISYYKLNPKK